MVASNRPRIVCRVDADAIAEKAEARTARPDGASILYDFQQVLPSAPRQGSAPKRCRRPF